MPRVPSLPTASATNPAAPSAAPASPENFLLAAADLHSAGEFQSAPVPTGKALQTGHKPSRAKTLQIVK